MYTYGFERLDVWQLARGFAVFLYQLTEKFPGEERYGIVSQLRRGGVSIASNLAEGSARTTSKDQARFYQSAYSATIEVLNQLIISQQLHYLTEQEYSTARIKIEEITNKINALRKAALKKG